MDSLTIVIAMFGIFIPLCWIWRIYSKDQLISGRLAITGIIAHLLICSLLFSLMRDTPWALFSYCSLVLVAIAVNPLVKLVKLRHEEQLSRQIARENRADALATTEREPGSAAMHAAAARLCLERGRYDEAIMEFEMAIALDPQHAQQEHTQLKRVRAEKKRWEQLRKRGIAALPHDEVEKEKWYHVSE